MTWLKVSRSFFEAHGILPNDVLHGMTIHQLEALSAPSGKITPEQALDLINEKRTAKGLDPLNYLP